MVLQHKYLVVVLERRSHIHDNDIRNKCNINLTQASTSRGQNSIYFKEVNYYNKMSVSLKELDYNNFKDKLIFLFYFFFYISSIYNICTSFFPTSGRLKQALDIVQK